MTTPGPHVDPFVAAFGHMPIPRNGEAHGTLPHADVAIDTAFTAQGILVHRTGIPPVDHELSTTAGDTIMAIRQQIGQTFGALSLNLIRQPRSEWVTSRLVNTDASLRSWFDHILATESHGIGRSFPLIGLGVTLQLNYSRLVELTNVTPDDDFWLQQLALTHVDNEPVEPEADYSRETLDARTQNFLLIMQAEMSRMFLDDAMVLASIGQPGQKATRQLMEAYSQRLFVDDLGQKIQMHLELERTFLAMRRTKPGRSAPERMLHSLARRAGGLARGVEGVLDYFRVIYTALDYEMPEALRTDEEEAMTAAGGVALGGAAVAGADIEPSDRAEIPEPDLAIVTEVESRSSTLAVEITDLDSRLPSLAGRTGQTYRQAVLLLKRGINSADQELIGPRTTDAEAIIRTILYLERLPLDETALERVIGDLNIQSELVAQSLELGRLARSSGISPPDLPIIPRLKETMDLILQNAAAIEPLINTAWPATTREARPNLAGDIVYILWWARELGALTKIEES